MSAAENVLSMKKISHRVNEIKIMMVNKELQKCKPSNQGVFDLGHTKDLKYSRPERPENI